MNGGFTTLTFTLPILYATLVNLVNLFRRVAVLAPISGASSPSPVTPAGLGKGFTRFTTRSQAVVQEGLGVVNPPFTRVHHSAQGFTKIGEMLLDELSLFIPSFPVVPLAYRVRCADRCSVLARSPVQPSSGDRSPHDAER